jgi:formyl-CoA transferase
MTERLFRAIGRAELIDDPRFRSNEERLKYWRELDAIIAPFIAERTQAENVEYFERTEVTIGPILDISQILEDPHVRARDILVELPDADMERLPMHHHVPRLSGTPGVFARPAPRLGEHSGEILARIGIAGAELQRLIAERIVVTDAPARAGQQGPRDEA